MTRLTTYLTETRQKVGLMPGRFQPLTNSHLSIIEQGMKENDVFYVMLVKGKSSNKDKNPFDVKMQEVMIKKVLPKVKVMIIPTADVFLPVQQGKIKGERFILYCGPDRQKQYQGFTKYFESIGKEFQIRCLDIGRDVVSATKVREAIRNNDIKTFQSLVPKKLYVLWDEMRKEIE